MEETLNEIKEIIYTPKLLINECSYIPDFIKESLTESLYFIPLLYFLYYGIELLERFFLKNIKLFVKLLKSFGPIFAAAISIVPECGYSVIASTFFARKLISRGTLLAFFISCSDDALPVLFLDLHKAPVIIPIIIIKFIVAVIVAAITDFHTFFNGRCTEDINAVNTDLYEPGCCQHRITTDENPPFWHHHPAIHTFNMFMFTFLGLAFINCIILGSGGVENLSEFLKIDTPYQVVIGAALGMVSNCAISVLLALAYIKGLLCFPAFLAGLITTTGLGLVTLSKYKDKNNEHLFISIILFMVAVLTGLIVFQNMNMISDILKFIFN